MNVNKRDEKSCYDTSDLSVAAFLKASKIPLEGLKREGNRVFFQFSNPKAESLALSFFNDAKVSAASYARALQELKTLIHGRVSS